MVLIKYFAATFVAFCQANLSAPFDRRKQPKQNDIDVQAQLFAFYFVG